MNNNAKISLMKSNHTPAPWVHDDGHVFTENAHGTNSEYNSIASVHEIYDDNGAPQSNAKLITAAPELLQALLTAQDTLIKLNVNSICDNTLLLVTNAIKKATE